MGVDFCQNEGIIHTIVEIAPCYESPTCGRLVVGISSFFIMSFLIRAGGDASTFVVIPRLWKSFSDAYEQQPTMSLSDLAIV